MMDVPFGIWNRSVGFISLQLRRETNGYSIADRSKHKNYTIWENAANSSL